MKNLAWMKNSQNFKSVLVATLAMLTMVGCANNKSDSGARVRAANTSLPTTPGSVAPGSMNYVSSNGGGGNINSAVQALLGESIPSGTQVGTVDPNTGITFAGQVHFDAASPIQNMISSSSYIQIQIKDSYAVSSPTKYSPFLLSVGMNSSGVGQVQAYSGYDAATLVFQDSYGWIMLAGSFNAQTYTGYAYFGPGNYDGTSGTYLANFSIPTCSFFSCQ